HIYKMNYADMLAFHQAHNAGVTVGVIEMPTSQARGFGIVEVDAHQQIVGFEEKPANPKPIPGQPDRCFASMGIYLFNRGLLEQLLIEDAQRPESTHDFGKDVFQGAARTVRAM